MPERWFKIDGADGDRTLEEQLTGLEPMLEEVSGKTVLDIGCAEGLVSIECARRGAIGVRGIEVIEGHVEIARHLAKDMPCDFLHANAESIAAFELSQGRFGIVDIVLALAVLHKFRRPQTVVKYICAVAQRLAVIRYPGGSEGIIRDERSEYRVINVPVLMGERGFEVERTEQGPRGELTAYFRKRA